MGLRVQLQFGLFGTIERPTSVPASSVTLARFVDSWVRRRRVQNYYVSLLFLSIVSLVLPLAGGRPKALLDRRRKRKGP